MLDWGLPLSLKIEQADISGKKVFKVPKTPLRACFDMALMKTLPKQLDEPLRMVFKSGGFKKYAKINKAATQAAKPRNGNESDLGYEKLYGGRAISHLEFTR